MTNDDEPARPRTFYDELVGARLFDPLAERDRAVEQRVADSHAWLSANAPAIAQLQGWHPALSAPADDGPADEQLPDPVEVAPGVFHGPDGWCEDRPVVEVVDDVAEGGW